MNTDYNAISRNIFNSFQSGKITEEEFVWKYDSLYNQLPMRLQAQLRNRIDHRTLGEFALSMLQNTRKERGIIVEWLRHLKKLGVVRHFMVESTGVDDTGLLLITKEAADFGRCDFCVKVDDKKLSIELKTAPTLKKLTYKVADLENYSRRGCHVLTIIKEPDRRSWVFFGPEVAKRMLNEIPVRKHREMGYKLAVQLTPATYEEFFTINKWE